MALPRSSPHERPIIELTPLTAVPGIYASYQWKNVAFTLWFGPATPESLVTFENSYRQCAQTQRGRLSNVNIMVPGATARLPSAEARSRLAHMAKEVAEETAAVAVIIPGQGFWASALRGLITALFVVVSHDYEAQIFGTIEATAEWLPKAQLKRTGVPLDAGELLLAIQQVQSISRSAAA